MTEKSLPNYKWIKFNLDYLHDPDFMQLSDGATGAYLKLYLLAGRSDSGGLICNKRVSNLKDLAWYLRIPPQIMEQYLAELNSAGLVTQDGEGYRIARFIDEQGPGDNTEREKWRQRQASHRAKASGALLQAEVEQKSEAEKEQEKESDQNLRSDQDPEEEGEREVVVEVEVDLGKESHGDITVTNNPTPTPQPPPAPALSAKDSTLSEEEEAVYQCWLRYVGRKLTRKQIKDFLEVIHGETEIKDWTRRLVDCIVVWVKIAEEHRNEGWSAANPDAVMELYPLPNLEERMEREYIVWPDPEKEQQRKNILETYGL